MVYNIFNQDEEKRNSFGQDDLFVHISHPLGEGINSFCKKVNGDTKFFEAEVIGKIDSKFRCVIFTIIILSYLLAQIVNHIYHANHAFLLLH